MSLADHTGGRGTSCRCLYPAHYMFGMIGKYNHIERYLLGDITIHSAQYMFGNYDPIERYLLGDFTKHLGLTGVCGTSCRCLYPAPHVFGKYNHIGRYLLGDFTKHPGPTGVRGTSCRCLYPVCLCPERTGSL